MPNLNKATLMGHMTRDAEVKYTAKGTAVGDFGIAVNRRVKDGNDKWSDEVTFIDITVWGKTAEYVQKYTGKGSPVFIEGRLQMDTWEDKQSGQKRSKMKVVAESVQSLQKREGGQESQQRSSQPPPKGQESWDEFDDDSDSIPF